MFAIPEGEATLGIKNVLNQEIASCVFDTSSPLVYYIGEEVELDDYMEIVTSNGNVYEGFFENNN